MGNIPRELEKCPIIDAVLDLQFDTDLDQNAVFGVVYSTLRDEFGKVESLPLAMTPEPIRNSDPILKYKPLYRITNNSDPNYIVQIGPCDVTISSSPKYCGWDVFSKNIAFVLDKLFKLNIVSVVKRLGIRYINFFENLDIYSGNTNIEILSNGSSIPYKETMLKTIIKNGEYSTIVQVANEMMLNTPISSAHGSIIDIDTFICPGNRDISQVISSVVDGIHAEEKVQFFSLLNPTFLNQLKPRY